MAADELNEQELNEIFESFTIETSELLEKINEDLMALDSTPDDPDVINRLFRSFHTIKGTSSFMGFAEIATITHNAEDLLNKLRKNELKLNQSIVDALFECRDWISHLLERILLDRAGSTSDISSDSEFLIKKIQKLASGAESQNDKQEKITAPAKQTGTPHAESAVEAVLADPSFGVHDGDFTDDEIALLEKAFAEVNNAFKTKIEQTLPIDDKVKKIEEGDRVVAQKKEEEAAKERRFPAKSGKIGADTTIRVDVARLETLMNLSGELVLGRNRLTQISDKISSEFEGSELIRHLMETSAQVDFVTSEIQTAVMKMRMAPIAKLFQKAPRLVRDLAKEFNKDIALVLKGEETELDRGIIEDLNDPLVHMIRNCCDHGIENIEDRVKAGKSPQGTITLEASQEGNMIVMKVIDDGKGMDPEKIKNKAIEKGVISSEQAALMSNRDILQLVFLPGFSTAAKVSSVSGRGVGMDVVRSNIQKLKGLIDIESEVGKGSAIVIKLPLTLAIIQGLVVRVAGETYALPLSSVLEVVGAGDVEISLINQKEVARIRNQVLPLLRLGETLGAPDSVKDLKGRYIVAVGIAHQRIGIVVDELLGQQEIVIKSLGNYLGRIPGITGSTILGDGSVIMIIDIQDLVELLQKEQLAVN